MGFPKFCLFCTIYALPFFNFLRSTKTNTWPVGLSATTKKTVNPAAMTTLIARASHALAGPAPYVASSHLQKWELTVANLKAELAAYGFEVLAPLALGW